MMPPNMSYDLIFSKDEPLSDAEVEQALSAEMPIERDSIGWLTGPWFSASLTADGEVFFNFGWSVIKSPAGYAALADVRHVMCDVLAYTCYNPQLDEYRYPVPLAEVPDNPRNRIEERHALHRRT